MKTILRHQRNLYSILICIIFVIGYASYLTISNIVAEQSRLQQQSIAPVFSLVVEELYKPVHTAQALASTGSLSNLLTDSELDQAAILNHLEQLQENLNMLVFVASEQQQMQFNSDGTTIDLLKENIEWYPKVKAMQGDTVAILGNRENVHLYVDIKVYSEQGDFLGFIGVGKSLQSFWEAFQQYKATHGYDLLFVNNVDEVVLSSHRDFQAQFTDIVNLNELSWFKNAAQELANMENLSSIIIQIEQDDHVVTQFNLPQLDWRVFLISPMAKRQAEINYAFFSHSAQLAAILFFLLLFIYAAFAYQRKSIEARINIDPLTKLANRDKINHWFEEHTEKENSLALIMVDIDHFKNINDLYGHNTGDKVIKEVAKILRSNLGEQDVASRWGGEEFIIFMPNTSLSIASQLAEKIRKDIELNLFTVNSQSLKVTASFGVTQAQRAEKLESIVADADRALYEAKQQGRNRVRKAF